MIRVGGASSRGRAWDSGVRNVCMIFLVGPRARVQMVRQRTTAHQIRVGASTNSVALSSRLPCPRHRPSRISMAPRPSPPQRMSPPLGQSSNLIVHRWQTCLELKNGRAEQGFAHGRPWTCAQHEEGDHEVHGISLQIIERR